MVDEVVAAIKTHDLSSDVKEALRKAIEKLIEDVFVATDDPQDMDLLGRYNADIFKKISEI